MREPKSIERRGLPYLIEIATNLFPIWILIGMILEELLLPLNERIESYTRDGKGIFANHNNRTYA
ncbi:hypothetical protein CEN40_02980 [Fischerella thermalis CCMEE 5205]|uniref:Uncharacterized protein n=1 Tax=Fischerella thermalis CCMEE 5318 TaxID=2019666 RepID=A0A2N6L8C9_9CYAN|nr:hypothetical protein [Fischerella thermalis]PMB18242.1 hypothetical protein CEN47_24715 [Fischerella thermalis CCMEE 5319]PMB18344.1 hypothetical protein CEN46_21320 [Fischerella thermalis CCMEE 5318]PMB50096.1 hypothetical protein CEN40_02980 [Fischerella thermalis CCMEE 5205]